MVLTVVVALLGVTFGVFYGMHKAPKNAIFSQLKKDYEETITGLRLELKRAKATANWYKQGAIQADVVDATEGAADDPTALVDAIIGALPNNFRPIAGQFRQSIIDEAKRNPAAVKTIIEVVKQKGMKRDGDSQETPIPNGRDVI